MALSQTIEGKHPFHPLGQSTFSHFFLKYFPNTLASSLKGEIPSFSNAQVVDADFSQCVPSGTVWTLARFFKWRRGWVRPLVPWSKDGWWYHITIKGRGYDVNQDWCVYIHIYICTSFGELKWMVNHKDRELMRYYWGYNGKHICICVYIYMQL